MKLQDYCGAKEVLEKGASLVQNDPRFTKMINECALLAGEKETLIKPVTPSSPPSPTPASVGFRHMEPALSIKARYRHEYYQKPEEVVLTIFAKGIPAKNVAVDFGEQIVSVSIDVLGEDVYHFQPRLFGKIIPEKCRYEVLSSKIEICLVKA